MPNKAALAAKWQRYHDRLPETFWQRVDSTAGDESCWPWKGSRRANGYGRLRIHGRYELAHRMAFQFKFGVDPAGCVIMHKCDNPCCCNPRHLTMGTHTDNMRDRSEKGRAPLHLAKLTYTQACEIFRRLQSGERGSDLAREFGVSQTAVSRIKTGQTWINPAALRARSITP
jgi:hypothetical protein